MVIYLKNGSVGMVMKLRKYSLVIPIILFSLVFAGCERTEKTDRTEALQKTYRVAILLASDTYIPLSAEGFLEGMRELGYREGQDIAYTVYNAKGDRAKLKSLALQIVESRPDVICPSIVTAIDAVRETGTELPVVFLESMYPVEFGIVESLVRPGTNYTGVSNMTGPMSGKRLELLTAMDSRIRRVAVISNPANKVSMWSLETTKEAAEKLGLLLDIYLVNTPEEVDEAIVRVETSPANALVLNPDFMVFSRLEKIIDMARRRKIPTMGIDSSQAEKGILASYGGGLKEIARQAAQQVDRVLRGENPAVIPIQAPRRYKLYVNMQTAEEIGLQIPDAILYQAEGYFR